MLNLIIDSANNNAGFISLISLVITVVVMVCGIVSGFFKRVWNKFIPTPSVMAASIIGANYPREITLEFENLTKAVILIHTLDAKINTGVKYDVVGSLPLVLREGKNTLRISSNLEGINKQHKNLQIYMEFGFPNDKKYKGSIAWEIQETNGIDIKSKHILP